MIAGIVVGGLLVLLFQACMESERPRFRHERDNINFGD
jgi:hypothetical protein